VIVGRHEANVVLKDNDLHIKISLDVIEARRVLEILKKDSDLLAEIGVLDYSLLVGVKKKKFAVEATNEDSDTSPNFSLPPDHPGAIQSTFKASSVTGPAIYYLGVVDFLQDWTTQKKIERIFKIYFTRKDPDGLSVMNPEPYKMRFQGQGQN
jgi:1-phosphatidylinositol-4-phosphate 5-kinase